LLRALAAAGRPTTMPNKPSVLTGAWRTAAENTAARRAQLRVQDKKRTEMDKNVKCTEMDLKKVKKVHEKKGETVKLKEDNVLNDDKRWANKRWMEKHNKLKEKNKKVHQKKDKKVKETRTEISKAEQIVYKNGLLSILKDCKGLTLKQKVDLVIDYTEECHP
jgi:hypothetical protein